MKPVWLGREFAFLVVVVSCLGAGTSHGLAQAAGVTIGGLQFLDDQAYQSIPLAQPPLYGMLPGTIDMSANFGTPGNQGSQQSCVGWAAANLKTYQEAVERNWNPDQPDHRFSPAFIYNQIKISIDCSGGSLIVDALNLLHRQGAAPLATFPYSQSSCSAKPDASISQSARQFAIAGYQRINVQDETEVKSQLAAGFPLLIGMNVDDAFASLRGDQIYRGSNGPLRGGHAMVVVGYDDQRGAYKVVNSWGINWGAGGFGWISYNAFRRYVREAYKSDDIVNNQPPPPPGPVPPTPPLAPPAAVTVVLHPPVVGFNLPVSNSIGGMSPGIRIGLSGHINGAKGKTLQFLAKFNYLGGQPLRANPQEPKYRDISGFVITGSPGNIVGTDDETINQITLELPYYALNLPWSGGANTFQLSMVVTAMVDNIQEAQSMPVPLVLRW